LFGRMFNSQVAARRIAKVFAFPFGFASFGLVCELVSHGGDGTGLQAFETGSQAYGIVHALAFLVSVPARYVWCGWAAETASAAWTEDA
ncbi:hypothetical protein QOZ79_33855, partial [Pseudomonas aeruginosa]|uniref:hypothetical protein n=1 Tax=Pseudomonas aeruginosa TaxID=287 RepID=UPI0034581894